MFFAIRQQGGWFIFNFALGLEVWDAEIRCQPEHLELLQERADALEEDMAETAADIERYGWIEMLLGHNTLAMPVELSALDDGDYEHIREHGWQLQVFVNRQGRRFYVRDVYYDIAEDLVGLNSRLAVLRSAGGPADYRPLVFYDGAQPRGLLTTYSRQDLREPQERALTYKQYLEHEMPELFERYG